MNSNNTATYTWKSRERHAGQPADFDYGQCFQNCGGDPACQVECMSRKSSIETIYIPIDLQPYPSISVSLPPVSSKMRKESYISTKWKVRLSSHNQ